jgi:hypothetical protein
MIISNLVGSWTGSSPGLAPTGCGRHTTQRRAADRGDQFARHQVRRKLRAVLYRPLLGLDKEERGRVVDIVLAILLDSDHDADA